jgi:DNA-binding transcriptional LysR family regulator
MILLFVWQKDLQNNTCCGGWGMNWDDFRFFAAVARAGSVRGAAAELQVNPSTVTRRLEALESRLGVMLFLRTNTGLQITAEGADVARQIDVLGEQLNQLDAQLQGRNQRLEGKIRLAVPDVLAVSFVLADLAQFCEQYDEIELEIIPVHGNLDIANADVDVAILATETPPDTMVGRPLYQVAVAAYGSRKYIAEHDISSEDAAGLAWIDWAARGEVMGFYARLRERYFAQSRVRIRCDQVFMQQTCIRVHMGIGVLPCYLSADQGQWPEPEQLQRMPQMPVQKSPTLWLLTHPELRNARRVQLLVSLLREVFATRQQALLDDYL